MGNTCAGFQYFNGYWNEFHSGTKDGFWFSKNNLFSGLNPIFSKQLSIVQNMGESAHPFFHNIFNSHFTIIL